MISIPHQISVKLRRMRCREHVAGMGEKISACRVTEGKHEGRKLSVRPRRRYKNNVKMDFKEVGWEALTGLIWFKTGPGG
jgi:hypothetical protein